MFCAKPSCYSLSAAAFSRASHFRFGVVFTAHTPCLCLVGAVIKRAWFFVMRLAESPGVDFVGAVVYGAQLCYSLRLRENK